MKFRSRDGEMKRLALTDGRVWRIGTDWKFLPEDVHSEAYAIGCVSEDMIRAAQDMVLPGEGDDAPPAAPVVDAPPEDIPEATNPVEPPVTPENRHATILEKMRVMIDSGEEGTMTAKGLPNKKKLTELTGFAATAEEFTKAWAVIISEQ